MFQKKTVRYYYWLTVEFITKHAKLIFLSALISAIAVIGGITVSPYVANLFASQTTIIGMVGEYTVDQLPDEITTKISNGLVYVNDKGAILPLLAAGWETSNNGRTYRFQIKKNLMWSDNKPFTVKDIVYRFRDVGIKTEGDYIIEFNLQKPLAIFPTLLNTPIIRYPTTGIGGLYRVERLKTKYDNITEISLSPNKKDKPALIYRFYPNEAQMIVAYKLGLLNQMVVSKKTTADTFLHWKNTVVERTIDYSRLLTVFFNYRNPQLAEKEMRNAIDSAIDRARLAEMGTDTSSSIPPTSWAYNTNLKKKTYDMDYAKRIIRKFRSATDSARLNLVTFYEYLDIADNIAQDLQDAGLPTTVSVSSYSNQGDFDLMLAYLKVPQDPDQYFYWHSTQNFAKLTGYKNLRLDKLLEDGRSTNILADRKKYYLEVQKFMDDDNTAIFLHFPYIYTVKRK